MYVYHNKNTHIIVCNTIVICLTYCYIEVKITDTYMVFLIFNEYKFKMESYLEQTLNIIPIDIDL